MTVADRSVLGKTQIFGTAPLSRAFNVVILADGFTASQQNDFNQACDSFVTTFLKTSPFDVVKSAINIFRINVASIESGADDPKQSGGNGSTARTYFDSRFGENNIRRLLVCNVSTALQVAAKQVPEFTVVLVIINSSVFGGSGGQVATFSLAEGASEIAIHETGHTAFGLGDEYAYYDPNNDGNKRDRHPPVEPTQPNVTINTNRSTLKWKSLVLAATPLPTMQNPDCSKVDKRPSQATPKTVGLFEGADYFHCNAYRPEYDCKMRTLGMPFCNVCRQVILTRIGRV